MDIKDLDGIWNSAFNKEMKNMYDDSKTASDYDNSINIKNDGIKRANAFNFPKSYTVLDIGAGPGILALPLSKIVKEVVAVEPSIEIDLKTLLLDNLNYHKFQLLCLLYQEIQIGHIQLFLL